MKAPNLPVDVEVGMVLMVPLSLCLLHHPRDDFVASAPRFACPGVHMPTDGRHDRIQQGHGFLLLHLVGMW